MTDLLSSLFSGEIAETYIRKIYKLMNVIIIFALIWTVINLLELYKYIDDSPSVSRLPHSSYQYTLLPVITIAQLAMNVIWILLLHKAWGNWKTYIETSDDNLLHKGLKNFYSATVLLVIWFTVSVANALYSTFII